MNICPRKFNCVSYLSIGVSTKRNYYQNPWTAWRLYSFWNCLLSFHQLHGFLCAPSFLWKYPKVCQEFSATDNENDFFSSKTESNGSRTSSTDWWLKLSILTLAFALAAALDPWSATGRASGTGWNVNGCESDKWGALILGNKMLTTWYRYQMCIIGSKILHICRFVWHRYQIPTGRNQGTSWNVNDCELEKCGAIQGIFLNWHPQKFWIYMHCAWSK